jgi:hypothetical protein
MQISKQINDEVLRNRSCIATLGRIAVFCARQDIALRGTNESVSTDLQPTLKSSTSNQGNYLELLNLLKRESTEIKKKMSHLPHNATYTSKESQNELLSAAGSYVRDLIVNEVKASGFYSVIVDEARDNSRTEQMSICVRYVCNKSIKERFLTFADVQKLNAVSLANKIEAVLVELGLPIQMCVSQAYDGASVMSGAAKGVQVTFREKTGNPCPYVHCNAHRLNLVLVDVAHAIDIVANTFGLLEAIYAFQSVSTLRHDIFIATQQESGLSILEIPQQSDTRWVCKFRGVHYFLLRFACVVQSLKQLISSSNKKEAAEARGLLSQFASFSVIFTLTILHEVLEITNSLSDYLQTSSIDYGSCSRMIASTIETIKNMRTEKNFEIVWDKVVKFAIDVNIQIPGSSDSENERPHGPRRKSKQSKQLLDSYVLSTTGATMHSDADLSDSKPETVFRIQFFELLDQVVGELNSRFNANTDLMSAGSALNPVGKCFLSWEMLSEFVEKHQHFEINVSMFRAQCEVARNMFTSSSSELHVTDTMTMFSVLLGMKAAFPDLLKVMQLFLTMPVSTATAERSFSAMRRIKTYLRASMKEKRLCDCAILSIERDISESVMANPEEIVTRFASMKQRRINLIT